MIQDDANAIVERMRQADVIVFATPIYFYEMCGQMKTLLDRSNPIFPTDYAFRDIYLVATSADGDRRSMDGAIKGLQGWVNCFGFARLAGVIYGVGVDKYGDIQSMPDLLEQARTMGRTI